MLLKTKLHMPRPRKDALPRPRLVDWLGANVDKPLLLVSAPAGYGKTTLLAQFTADAPLPIGWYQLDVGDNDPAAFLEYVVECIASCYPEFGATTGALLESIQSIKAEWERLGVVLINEIIETVPEDILIVLEDYHFIDNPLIHASAVLMPVLPGTPLWPSTMPPRTTVHSAPLRPTLLGKAPLAEYYAAVRIPELQGAQSNN